MSKDQCATCLNLKATLECKSCVAPICKKCAQFFSEDQLSYLDGQLPPLLKGGGAYCNSCFGNEVQPYLNEYNEILGRAREVFVFFKDESKETRLIPRSEKTFKVEGDDKGDIVLKLAFLSARAGYNAVVDIQIVSQKRRDGSYKLVSWSGSGTAANVDARKHN